MSIFNVSPKKEKELSERMQKLGVSESDLEEKFILSSGPGGQKVNKTSTCVSLHHLPTGIKVKCMKERSQPLNRFFARRLILDQIERMQKGFIAEERKKIEKIRSRKRKRAKSAKEKMKKIKNRETEEREE